MTKLWLAWLAVAGVSAGGENPATWDRYEFTRVEMAVPFKISLYAPDRAAATQATEAAFARVHALNASMSDYDPESEVNRLCQTAGQGKAQPVSDDLWRVLEHAQALSAQSEGAFDVTIGPVVRLWRRARRRGELPPPRLAAARAGRLSPPAARSPAAQRGTAQGRHARWTWAASPRATPPSRPTRCCGSAISRGPWSTRAATCGWATRRRAQTGWKVALMPLDGERPVGRLVLANMAVSTSGDNVQFVVIDGRRWSHIIDPRSGQALTDHSRVTVVAPDGMTADGLTKAVVILGPDKGLKLIDETPHAAALLMRAPHGTVERYASGQWPVVSGQ